jgi:mono/diheme cytochrome c family protein
MWMTDRSSIEANLCLPALLALGAALLCAPVARAAANPDDARFFETTVRPILQANCVKCHGGEKTKGGLKLLSRDSILAGGETGAVVVSGKASTSLLVDAIGYKNDKLQMPPSGKLAQDQIDALTKWVEMGLPWSGAELAGVSAATSQPATAHHGPPTIEEGHNFWSFKPVVRPEVPKVKNALWVRNPIDAFILAKLESKGLTPAEPADKVTLIRRATYDLTGLPPSIAEVDAFVADPSPDAYEKLVDRLLASPRYGEKWGRHWLDLVRFAETNSYERDSKKPNAWRYRDYVIRSFNDDKPYDRFVKEQLAGDELPDAEAHGGAAIVATGIYRLGIFDDDAADKEQARYDNLDDIVATVGQTFLGVTLDCARCHDHKIDPIPQHDYYKILAFFQNLNDYRNGGPTDERVIPMDESRRADLLAAQAERKRQLDELKERIKGVEETFKQVRSGDPNRKTINTAADLEFAIKTEGPRVLGEEPYKKYAALKVRLKEVRDTPVEGELALAVTERGPQAPDTFVTIRGNAHAPGAKVEPGFLEVITPGSAIIPTPAANAKTSGRRTVLADWIASKDNPLTARVMANRIWQYHFGRGIVRSSSNFGFQGDAPTHPELLDWLASEFVSSKWSLKRMHRLMMLSNAYRMSSTSNQTTLAADPRNDLFWRFDVRRLTAEEIRDSVLAANGTLNLAMYGPGVFPPIPKAVMQGQSRPGEGWGKATPEEACRRSVYVHAKRSLRVPIIESFDGAETDKACPVRFVTVQPTQALGMINGEFLNDEAKKLATRVKTDAGDDVAKRVTLALRLVTSRQPAKADVERGVTLYEKLTTADGASPEQAMQYVCLVVLNLNEFVYVD